jgi:hypothetical protein
LVLICSPDRITEWLCSIQHVARNQTVTASTSAWADHCQVHS